MLYPMSVMSALRWGLCCAVPCRAVLCCSVLCCAVLCCAVLCCAVLCCADDALSLCAYAGGYSGVPVDDQTQCVSAAGFDHKLCMAWRQDNAGPHSAEEVGFAVSSLLQVVHTRKTPERHQKDTRKTVMRSCAQQANKQSSGTAVLQGSHIIANYSSNLSSVQYSVSLCIHSFFIHVYTAV